MANKKQHLKAEERYLIQQCLMAGDSYRTIAKRLGRGLSTIAAEVVAHGGQKGYTAKEAHQAAYLSQYHKKKDCMKVAMDSFLAKFVEEKLRKKWSPERISGYLKKEQGAVASPKAIRKFARSRGLESYLYRRGKTHRPKTATPASWQNRTFVDDPRCVREGYGHWEADFIVSSQSTAVLLVLVERMTKDTLIRLLPHRANDLVRTTIVSALSGKIVRSFTTDNDIAFVQHQALSHAISAPVFFARPYRSTDKALVENTNRWVRWFVPKKTNIADVPYEKVLTIEEWFNSVPRQCLNFRTSREMVSLQKLATHGCSY